MRVLLVTLGLPYPPDSGTRIRDFNLLRQLSGSVQVCLCSLLTEDLPPDWIELERYCETIETFRPPASSTWRSLLRGFGSGRPLATRPYYFVGMEQKIRGIVQSRAIDVVQIEHSFLACYRDAIPHEAGCRTILSFHNVGSLQYRRIASLKTGIVSRLGFLVKAALMQSWEAKIAAHFDRSLVVSGKEAELLHAEDSTLPVSVIENGVDCELYQPLPEPASNPTLLFLGVLSYPPNTDAVVWFVREIWPLIRGEIQDAQLRVAGHSPPAELQGLSSAEGISVSGYVKELLSLYQDTHVVIVPLRAGGGTRLKILEAMALGRIVVSTSIGCEGLEVTSGVHLIIADTPDEFAAGVLLALTSPQLRRRIASNARKLVEGRYSWANIGRKLIEVYRDTCFGDVRCP
jgi:sugar transferase (PEP-CTERM/EpsH1 system associated)